MTASPSGGRGTPARERTSKRPIRRAVTSTVIVALASCSESAEAFGGSSSSRGPLQVAESTAALASSSRWRAGPRRQSPDLGRRRGETRLRMASSMPHANLAIRLDEPLLSPSNYRRPSTIAMIKYFLSVFVSDAFKFAAVAFLLAFGTSLLARSQSNPIKAAFTKVAGGVASFGRWAQAPFNRLADKVMTGSKAIVAPGPAVPMSFDGEGGWGVCTYLGSEPVGRSGYSRYDFALPRSDNVLPLSLGQHVSLCCLDDGDNVVQGEFFPYSTRMERGKFSILAPGGVHNPKRDEAELGIDRANFVRVLKTELDVGDEIALKPGGTSLEYRGQYLPVKEMVFVSSGEGIVPVLEQVRAVLPDGSSSVKLVSVVWLCKNTKDFDIGDAALEAEYRKYPSKLAVTCVDDDVGGDNEMEDNVDIVESVPNFIPGTMAVVSGPRAFRKKARKYLVDRGYPSDCICVLS